VSYSCIVADPPWAPRDKLPGKTRGAAKQYAVMTTEQICGYLESLDYPIADDAILFLWRLASMQQDALDVAKAWGFRVCSEVVWVKLTVNGLPHFGMGRTVRASHETCLICVRGRASRVVVSHSVRSVLAAKTPSDARGRAIHSAKPDEFFTEAARLTGGASPDRCLELFARKHRHGWSAIGDQLPALAA
jgi:N6-adenosine-specific RNA methylase IME4